jgi:hypothetical protein
MMNPDQMSPEDQAAYKAIGTMLLSDPAGKKALVEVVAAMIEKLKPYSLDVQMQMAFTAGYSAGVLTSVKALASLKVEEAKKAEGKATP